MNPLDLETACLRALIGDCDRGVNVARQALDLSGASEAHFSHENRALFTHIAGAIRGGSRPDPVLLSRALPERSAEILELASTARAGHSASRLGALVQSAARSSTAQSLGAICDRMRNSSESMETLVGDAQALLAALALWGSGPVSGDVVIDRVVTTAIARGKGDMPPLIQTGIEAIDTAIGGLDNTLILIGAQPGVGKSALTATMVRNIAAMGVKVGLLSLEDEADWWGERVLAAASGFDLGTLTGGVSGYGVEKLRDAQKTLRAAGGWVEIDDRHGRSTGEIVAAAHALIARGARVLFVDHLGEIAHGEAHRHDLAVSNTLRALRGVSKQHKLPVVVLTHLRREGGNDNAEPRLQDFAETAGAERMARVALGLWRKDGERPGEYKMMCSVLKRTKGPAGFNFELNVSRTSATVIHTPASDGLVRRVSGRG